MIEKHACWKLQFSQIRHKGIQNYIPKWHHDYNIFTYAFERFTFTLYTFVSAKVVWNDVVFLIVKLLEFSPKEIYLLLRQGPKIQ